MRISIIVFILIYSFPVLSQTDSLSNWKRKAETGVNINQASFSKNWNAGGVNSLALGSFFNGRAFYDSEKISFDNDLQLQYGFLNNDGQGFRKNSDRIFFDSKIGYKLTSVWNVYASVNFLSQFAPGFRFDQDTIGVERPVKISQFMSPGFLTSSVGLEYKPVPWFWTRFGAGSVRQTFVLDTTLYRTVPNNYGVPIGKTVRNEVAFVLTMNLDKDLSKNVNLKTRFTAFANYEDLKAIDTRLDFIFTAKVSRIINVNITGTVLYDQDMDYDVQYAQALSLGIMYSFTEFK
ncbi:MAG: DUF3078 domain-containing protein [Cytophagaceae bacterium]